MDDIPKDFKELLELFAANDIEFIIVGGYALAFHGAPRFTGDLDLFVRPDRENAGRILSALKEFGFGSLDLSEKDFESPSQVVQLGRPPVRVDIITSIDGVPWPEAWAEKTSGKCAEVPVFFIGRRNLIRNKRAVGRRQDLADLEALGEDESSD